MEITVKRRTWFIGLLMPLKLNFNGKDVASIIVFEEKVIPLTEKEGYLKYRQPLDRSSGIHVKDGDVIKIEETNLSKLLNILFLITAIYMITMRSHIFRAGAIHLDELASTIGLVLVVSLVILSMISFFFNSYKLVVENR